MGSFSIWHWLIVLAVVLLLFGGRGKISTLMGDFGKGLKAFKKGVSAEDEVPASAQPTTASAAAADPGKIANSAGAQTQDAAKDRAA
jgi:sec-independent protein translocase protein TatA